MKILIYGATGFIGSMVTKLLSPEDYIIGKARLENYHDLIQELNSYPDLTHCLLMAGLTGRPNVDWCQDHKTEVLSVNVIAVALLADLTFRRKIHFTFLSTGCIYEYDETHPMGGKGFREEDEPNFEGSFYSYSKILIEKIVKEFSNSLVLRIRMPISDDLHPRSFITKIIKYERVCNVPNSMSVLTDLLPLIPDMIKREITGVFNFTNGGVISHNEILSLYREYIDPHFTWKNFSLEEQAKILKAGRSNNFLDNGKLLSLYPHIPHIQDSIHGVFRRMKEGEVKT